MRVQFRGYSGRREGREVGLPECVPGFFSGLQSPVSCGSHTPKASGQDLGPQGERGHPSSWEGCAQEGEGRWLYSLGPS